MSFIFAVMPCASKYACEEEKIAAAVRQEEEDTRRAVAGHPYPAFKTMQERLKPHLELWAEYGEANHVLCKIIYDNCTDEDRVVDSGKRIFHRGGFKALQANYYVISAVLRDAGASGQTHAIEIMFEKVTPEWRA